LTEGLALDSRAALNSWTAGVTLVTVADGHDDVGTTVSAFCPVSDEPPLVALALTAGSYPAELFGRDSEPVTRFAVVLLADGQRMLAGRFAAAGRPAVRRMLGDVPHQRGPASGALIVEGGLAALECMAEQVWPAGDHLLVIARVTGVPYISDAGHPLIRFRRHYLVRPLGRLMPDFDTSVAHIARVYDYWLGGQDNFAADRELGEQTLAAYPNLVFSVRANRAFLARTVRFLAAELGIRQFLDIGTGIPTADTTHHAAQQAAPASRIVYVDNDPIVLSHAKALLKSDPAGACSYIDADLRDPAAILAAAAATLDFGQPVAVMLLAVLHFIGDDAAASAIVNQLTDACVPGSFLVISHAASDIDAEQQTEMVRRLNQSVAEKATLRDRAGVRRLFGGMDLVDPGIVRVADWRPDSELEASSPTGLWGGVARKP
jgi:flavin reductase (DIM6/NTAB) family NADH-FMN oxidoreductase RutF